MALSSFVRRVSGSKFPNPIRFTNVQIQKDNYSIGGRQLFPYLRSSTTPIETEVLHILKSDICNSTQVEGIGLPFEVEDNSACRMNVRNLDGEDIFQASIFFYGKHEGHGHDPQVELFGSHSEGHIKTNFNFLVKRDHVILNEFTISNYYDDQLKGFEKVFDDRGLNSRSLTNLFMEELNKEKHKIIGRKIPENKY